MRKAYGAGGDTLEVREFIGRQEIVTKLNIDEKKKKNRLH